MADTILSRTPATVTTLLTTTLENRRAGLQDQIFDDLPTIKFLKEKGSVILDGGATIVLPLMYGTNSTAQFYDGYQQLDTTPQEGFTQAQYTWKEMAVSVSVSNREENVQNQGASAVLSIVDSKIKQAEMSLKNLLNTQLYDSSPTSTEVGSLATTIDATSTIGSINSTTYTWWASGTSATVAFATAGRSTMLTRYNAAVVEGAAPNAIITTPTVHAYYEGSLIPQLRYASNAVGDSSFGKLMFKNCPVIMDNDCTSAAMYFINSDHLKLYVSSNNNLKMTEWVKPSNQTAKVAQIIWALELVTDNRRRLQSITTITA